MRKTVYFLFFTAVFLLIWNTEIANRTEAEDAFAYAWQVEHLPYYQLWHPHHLLYGPVARGIYDGAGWLGYRGRAYPLLRLLSALCGAGAVLMFFRFCCRRFSMRPVSSLLCSGLLLFSYGFWRYANEAEVYIPACFIMLCAIYLAVHPRQTAAQAAWAGILCGVSVLFHVLNIVPVFLAVPLFYLFHRNGTGLLIHLLSAGAVVLAGYLGVFYVESVQLFSSAAVLPAFSWNALIKGGVGFSQCVVSANFMLGYQTIRDALVTLFPTRMLLEELYLGACLPRWLVFGASVSFALLAGCFAGVTACALRLIFSRGDQRLWRDRVGTAEAWRTLIAVSLWFGGYAGALLLLEPGNPEVWVMGLVPFWLAFCGLIAAPLSRRNALWPVLLLTVLLAFHNGLGGMLPLKNPQADYNRQKAEWVLLHAGPDDTVLTAGNPVFERYLRYYCSAQVEDLYLWNEDQLAHSAEILQEIQLKHSPGTLYLLGDIFRQPVSLTKRFPEKTAAIARFAAQIRPFAVKIHEDSFGGVYSLPD